MSFWLSSPFQFFWPTFSFSFFLPPSTSKLAPENWSSLPLPVPPPTIFCRHNQHQQHSRLCCTERISCAAREVYERRRKKCFFLGRWGLVACANVRQGGRIVSQAGWKEEKGVTLLSSSSSNVPLSLRCRQQQFSSLLLHKNDELLFSSSSSLLSFFLGRLQSDMLYRGSHDGRGMEAKVGC